MATNLQRPDASYHHTLNVLFHGLWAYEIEDDGIVIRTAPQRDHRVAAGRWIPDAQLEQGATYEIQGIAGGTSSDFDPVSNAIFKRRQLVKGAQVFCAVRLPFPDKISSLRPISFHPDKPPYTGADASQVSTRQIAIVQVFTYKANLSDVRLIEKSSGNTLHRPADIGAADVANLYFFAQPDKRVSGSHFEEAFANLAAIYGLDLVPVPSVPPGPRTPDLPGVTWRDLVGLNERALFQSELLPAAGSSGSNCDPFVVDNRSSVAAPNSPTQSSVQHPTHPEPATSQ